MNKKVIGLFIIFFAAVLAMGSVGAATLKTNDFDGYFSMKVPKNVNFQKQANSSGDSGFNADMVTYASEDLVIMYMDSSMISENMSTFFYQSMFESMYPDLDDCYETQDGNLTILKPKTIDDTHMPIVGSCSGTKLVMIFGKDLDLIKEMGKSIKFK